MSLLIVLEHDRGTLPEASREALTVGRALAAQLDCPVEALLIGEGGDDLVAEAGQFGAETVHLATHDLLTDFGSDAWADTIVQIVEELDTEAVLAVGTDRGNEVMAQVAARMDLPFVANCNEVSPDADDDDVWTMTRTQWGGSLLEDSRLEADVKLVTITHHAVVAEQVESPVDPDTESFEPDLDEKVAVTMIKDRVVLTQGITLATAPIVISGGRGVGSADGFGVLDELAGELGGVVGCSRAVTNNGWRPHSDQVGQTGTRIAPELYIATGISGAIQHWVGAMASKRILAINTDPEANMVSKADYAVIADLHTMIPAITEEIRKRKG